MVEFSYLGTAVKLTGNGDKASPFVIKGTGWNPALAAEIESLIAGKYFEGRQWTIARTRTESSSDKRHLSVLTLKVMWDDDELIQTEMWFDITEAMTRERPSSK